MNKNFKTSGLTFITEDAKRKLIEEVKKYPCLWNICSETYHIQYERAKAWGNVALTCQCSSKTVVPVCITLSVSLSQSMFFSHNLVQELPQ